MNTKQKNRAIKAQAEGCQITAIGALDIFEDIHNWDTGSLESHPLNEKIYGATVVDPDLKRSIEQYGILQPLLVCGNKIISGHSRWLVAKELGIPKVPAINICYTDLLTSDNPDCDRQLSDLEAEALLIASNKQRVKTAGQIARETAELFRIEQALSAERMKVRIPVMSIKDTA